jgi:hypothetical protein
MEKYSIPPVVIKNPDGSTIVAMGGKIITSDAKGKPIAVDLKRLKS